MQYGVMDQKRSIDASKIPASGCILYKNEQIMIVLTCLNSFDIVDVPSGKVMLSVDANGLDAIYKGCVAAKRWNNHHIVTK